MKPALAVVIPTVGRATLVRTLDSLDGRAERDLLEVFVVADTHGGLTSDLEQARDHVRSERDSAVFHWREYDAGLHCWGHPQRMLGGRSATAPFVWYTQDDNAAAEGAATAILGAIAHQAHARPLFFRWLSPWRETIWRDQRLLLGNIDADCLVLPKRVAQQVTWGLRYEGDFDAAVYAMRIADGEVDWQDTVISIARPDSTLCWWEHRVSDGAPV